MKWKVNPRRVQPNEETSYRNMLSRCYNQKATGYEYYGGRGIVVCERWRKSFWYFLDDMGLRPGFHSIERVDTDGDYSPENCIWATNLQQANNKNDNTCIVINGLKKTVAEWGKFLDIKPNTITTRLRRGWSELQALELEEK